MLFIKSCNRCSGDVMIDSYANEDGSYDLFCIQCGNRSFPQASVMATLYKRVEKIKKTKAVV